MSKIKTLIKDWVPPAVVRALQNKHANRIRFEGNFATWEEASALCSGYAAEPILAKVLDSTLKVKRGDAAFERDSVLFDQVEYSWPVTAALMWAAAQNEGKLNVLDFGGALGSSYFQNRAFLSGLSAVSWSVVEQPHYVSAGLQHIQNNELNFYSSIEACLEEHAPTAVLLSSALQYLPDVDNVCECLRKINAKVILIDRTPFNDMDKNSLCIQHVPDSIYKASYPMWIFSYNRMLDNFKGWRLVARFKCPEGVMISDNGERIEFFGLILIRINDK